MNFDLECFWFIEFKCSRLFFWRFWYQFFYVIDRPYRRRRAETEKIIKFSRTVKTELEETPTAAKLIVISLVFNVISVIGWLNSPTDAWFLDAART